MTVRCPFCEDLSDSEVFDNGLVSAIRDRYPVSPGHTVVGLLPSARGTRRFGAFGGHNA